MTKLNSEEDRQALLLFLSKAKIDGFGLESLGIMNKVYKIYEELQTCPIEKVVKPKAKPKVKKVK